MTIKRHETRTDGLVTMVVNEWSRGRGIVVVPLFHGVLFLIGPCLHFGHLGLCILEHPVLLYCILAASLDSFMKQNFANFFPDISSLFCVPLPRSFPFGGRDAGRGPRTESHPEDGMNP